MFSKVLVTEKLGERRQMKKLVLMGVLLVTLAATMTPSFAETANGSTWVNVTGEVTSYDGLPAYGLLKAYGEIGEWANAFVFWTTIEINPPFHKDFEENFTYTFYGAMLVNSSIVELNYSGYDFYIEGLWDAYNFTWVYYADGNFSWSLEPMADDAPGELYVTGNWTQFAVAITGLELISGTVHGCVEAPKPIPVCDTNMDQKIDIWDLVHVAKAYGDTPGMPGGCYNFDIDFNFDFTIDIGDLTTIAANLGEEY